MKILFPERIEEFSRKHADAKEPLERWSNILADAQWKSHADLKADFPSADFVGNNRYVFNIKGNNYRTVVLVVFFAGTVAIRFIGTHGEYDKIKDIKNIQAMVIKNEKEYKDYEARVEKLIERGTELGDMELLSPEEKAEFTMLSEALDEYGRAYHPLPGRMSTLLTDAILAQVKERGLKQKEAAQMIGISATTFSDLLHGRRSMSFDIARSLYKVLGVPAEVVLA